MHVVLFSGRAGRDGEYKILPSGQTVGNINIAASESYKDKDGNYKQTTAWMKVTAWGKLAEKLRNIRKGEMVFVSGKITTNTVDKNGVKTTYTEISASEIIAETVDQDKALSEISNKLDASFTTLDIPFDNVKVSTDINFSKDDIPF